MLKYKLKENCVDKFSTAPMRDYLQKLGINKVDSFINKPQEEDEVNPFDLDNINKCLQLLHEGFTNNKKFFLQVDSDVDGITSSTIFYRFFKDCYPDAQIVWRLHEGKEHGVIVETVPDDAEFVIIPDAGSMQLEEQKQLLAKGKTIIIMDHHNVTEQLENDRLVIVNNQLGAFANKHLSGAGVVFKVIQAYARWYPNMFIKPQKYYDLAALGILSDMMDMRDLDNNYIVYYGLHNINNDMFKALLNQQSYSISDIVNPTKIDVVFYISPLINGVIRAGTSEEKELLFRGFIGEPSQDSFDTEYRGVARHEDYYQYVARNAYNIKNRQNTQKEKCLAYLKQKIEAEHLDQNKIIVVIASKDDKVPVPQNITGLVAMDLLKTYGKPTLVLRPKIENGELVYAGSGRGKQAEEFSSFLQFVRDSDYSEYGEGHDMAFGASIPAKNYNAFIQESNDRLANVDFGSDFIEVDAIFSTTDINHQMLYEFAKYNYIYGNCIPQPKIVITGNCRQDNILIMGKDKSSIRFNIGGLACVKFKDKELVEKVQNYKMVKFTIIGRPQINEWMGNESTQLIIDTIEVEPVQIASLF